MAARLPRLLYVGDIPIEATYQSSIQLHRLLGAYPPASLTVVETREPGSRPDRRLPGVHYESLPIADPHVMRGSFVQLYQAWLTATAHQHAARLSRRVDAFHPEAVLTIGSGFGWLLAAQTAVSLGVPLHLIAHDDWPKWSGAFSGWSRARFGRVYGQARTRLCVSPWMVEEYERRYSARATLLYPVRPADSHPRISAKAETIDAGQPVTIGFCGGSGMHVMPGLEALGRATAGTHARVIVYGPFDDARQRGLRSTSSAFEFRGFTGYDEMMQGLRDADLLFAPMTFAAVARSNMLVSFPSKLVDYTATGVPILVYAPPDASATRWARQYHDVAHIVDQDDVMVLRGAIEQLAADRDARQRLGERALAVGADCFSLERGRSILESALAS